MKYGVMARVSGGVTGTRESLCKTNGETLIFTEKSNAEEYASGCRASMNNKHSVARFSYWVVTLTYGGVEL